VASNGRCCRSVIVAIGEDVMLPMSVAIEGHNIDGTIQWRHRGTIVAIDHKMHIATIGTPPPSSVATESFYSSVGLIIPMSE
jgi:hypothetical protein